MAQVFKLCPTIRNYEWGKMGHKSAVALLLESEWGDDIKIDKNRPYAEMWIGTHISGPARIPSMNGRELTDWLHSFPENLGDTVTRSFSSARGLPFLLKVLSVNKALSVQAHPNKETALELHKKFPNYYPDDNHKPEMAIALTDFEALCGFRPISEIKTFFREILELQHLVGKETVKEFLNSEDDSYLKPLFTAVMSATPAVFTQSLVSIVKTFKTDDFKHETFRDVHDVFIRTADQYPGDIGCFCIFFLNYLRIKPGEAIFLAANEPHAYLYGDCIECMACSDNVVRLGLTPKFRDVQTLCEMLTYSCRTAEENKFLPISHPEDPYVLIYNPPVKEFAVNAIEIEKLADYSLNAITSASVLLIFKGTCTYAFDDEKGNLNSGSILFISSDCHVVLSDLSGILMYRAYCEV